MYDNCSKIINGSGYPDRFCYRYGVFYLLDIKIYSGRCCGSVQGLTNIMQGLESRVRQMNNDMIKIDLIVSEALELRPDVDRVARAENFMEDGKIDARRD